MCPPTILLYAQRHAPLGQEAGMRSGISTADDPDCGVGCNAVKPPCFDSTKLLSAVRAFDRREPPNHLAFVESDRRAFRGTLPSMGLRFCFGAAGK